MPAATLASDPVPAESPQAAILWQAHGNALLWGLGNGLASTTAAVYMARQLGAEGLAVAFLVASPNLSGGLRLTAPWLLQWIGSRKWFAVGAFLLSALLLMALPRICEPGHPADRDFQLRMLALLWGGWHLAMFLGMIAVWSWLADLVASRIRGAFIGVRTSWLKAGEIAGILLAAGFSFWYPRWDVTANPWQTPAWLAFAGACCMLVAVLPVVWMPDVKLTARSPRGPAHELWAALADRRFRPLLVFWCYAGLVNGVSQSAQGLYPIVALKLPIATTLSMVAWMHVGQIALSPVLGYFADRGQSRAIMIWSQVLVSLALLFFPLAVPAATAGQPAAPYGMWIAYTLFIAYAGLNVCLPHLMLKLSPGENSPPYISIYFALSGLAVACSSLLFGWLFDQAPRDFSLSLGLLQLNRFELLLYLGGLLRLSSVVWLFWLPREAAASTKIKAVQTVPQLAT